MFLFRSLTNVFGVMTKNSFSTDVISAGRNKNHDRLESIVTQCETKKLIEMAVQQVGRADSVVFWNYLLTGFKANDNRAASKKFAVIMAVLKRINEIDVPSKQCYDLVTRLFIELPKFSSDELVDLAKYCIESISSGNAKSTGWKDLFPEVIGLISDKPKIETNGTIMTGLEYRNVCIRLTLDMNWSTSILPSIADMFREMDISRDDKLRIVKKLCEHIHKMQPDELPSLSYQLFSLCTTSSHLIVPILNINEYFHRNYYKRAFSELTSEQTAFDSIEEFDEKELREAQDTILYHLSSCTEFKFTEREILNQFRLLASNPRFILTPFLISALIAMSNLNRHFDSTPLSSSATLPFLRSVIINNEREHEMCMKSFWCRTASEQGVVNLSNVFLILIDQSKEGTDVVTAGLVGLAYCLLKTPKNTKLHVQGIKFLESFVKKRHIFGTGVIKNICDFLLADQEAPQYAECLTRLGITNSFLFSDSFSTIREVIDFFLLIPGHHAMRMMQFLVPLLRHSSDVRDHFIETMRQAMYRSDPTTRQAGVFGFCLILKELRNNNAMRSSGSAGGGNRSMVFGSQSILSGFSLMSQQIVGTANNPNRHFDMTVLEIIGILRKCFSQTIEVKEVLYDSLTDAIEQNFKLIPHIIQFFQFRCYDFFVVDGDKLEIKFDKCVVEKTVNGAMSIVIYDHLGKMLQLFARCVLKCQQLDMDFATEDLTEFFEKLVQRIDKITMKNLGLADVLTPKLKIIGQQLMNCIETLIYYMIESSRTINEATLKTIFDLHEAHARIDEQLTIAASASKKQNKNSRNEETTENSRIISSFKSENIWHLSTVKSFLKTIFSDSQLPTMHSHQLFVQFILNATVNRVTAMRLAPDYQQIKYSKSNFRNLIEVSSIIFTNFIKNIENAIEHFEATAVGLSIEAFFQCLTTAVKLYDRKIGQFFESFRSVDGTDGSVQVVRSLQSAIILLVEDSEKLEGCEATGIPLKLVKCLETMHDHVPLGEKYEIESYSWLLTACKTHTFDSNQMDYINKLLFKQHMKSQGGVLFDEIAQKIETAIGQIEDEPLDKNIEIASISDITAESVTLYLTQALSKQIDHVEYFILKVKSLCAKLSIGGLIERHRNECEQQMKMAERRICSQLILISSCCSHLTNTRLPLGSCMDALIKLLIQLYICLANVAKHFNARHKIVSLLNEHSKFDQLIRAIGKPLPTRIYRLISYVEDNIFDDDEQSSARTKNGRKGAQAEKAKIVRDTKYIPKLILRVENFNKFVVCLSKKTKHDLSKFLHFGTVRDFRIRSADLKKAMESVSDDEMDLDDEMGDEDGEDVDSDDVTTLSDAEEDEANAERSSSSSNKSAPVASSSSNEGVINESEKSVVQTQDALDHLAVINKRANKRRKSTVDEVTENEPVAKRRSKRKENKK